MKRIFALFAFCTLLLWPVQAKAGEFSFDAASPFGDMSLQPLFGTPKEEQLLTVTLTPESECIVPGTPVKLLLTLNHAANAYSYWTNPGGPGMATKISWSLPEGFTISAPQWPTPQLYENGGMNFYVHKAKTSLVFTLYPPKVLEADTDIVITGKVATQVCTPRSCNPLHLDVATTVTTAREPGKSNPALTLALDKMPQKPRAWRFEAADYDDEIVIGMYPASDANPEPGDIYFFNSNAKPCVDSQKPQRIEQEDGVWWLRVPRLPGPSLVGENLCGIIRADAGWLAGDDVVSEYAIDLPIIAEVAAKPPGLHRAVTQNAGLLLLFAFLGGLILNVMPCVFPVIGLKIMGFAKQAHKKRSAIFLHGATYTAGVLICFWTLSFLVITMGRGWGAQLQSDWFMFALCCIFMIMSMNMVGVFDVGTSISGAGQGLSGRDGLKRSFFTGLLATLTSTPCSAPFLGTALAYALSLPPLLSLGVFTLMGLGFAFPYLALSLFPGWLKKLPKPGPWMDTFRQAMAFPLFATTAYLFWTMEAMLEEWNFLMLLFGLVLIAMACWLYGKYQHSRLKRPRTGRLLYAMAAVALVGGVWLGMPKSSADLQWQDWSPETVARLRREGRPVYVDFTARWCATCQLNKRVYSDEELRDLIENKNVALLKADWTQYDERITSTLRSEFNKAAVPVTVLYKPGEQYGDLLPDLLTVESVGAALKALP